MSDNLGPWPEKMYLLHPSLKSFGDKVTYPERREYVRADRIEQSERERDELDVLALKYIDLIRQSEAKLAKAVEALVAEREENLWNAYNIGVEYGGRWSDACMSDAEWLVDQCGLDPEFKDHDANAIKAAIPTAARRVLAELEGGDADRV